MNVLELRTQIQESIETLPKEKLLVAADFIAYLAEKELGDATEELLKISGFQESEVKFIFSPNRMIYHGGNSSKYQEY